MVVSTLGTIYSLGDSEDGAAELSAVLARDPAFNKATALSLMVFVLLYIPCVAAIGVMKKEVGRWKPVVLYGTYSIAVAWVMAFLTYRIALMVG